MNNQVTLTLGKTERQLNFSQMGFMQNLEEITGLDPIAFLSSNPTKPKETFDYIEKIVHAGLLTHCNIECVKPDFDAETVNMWVKGMAFTDGAKVITACVSEVINTLGGKKDDQGEAEAQTSQDVL